MMRLRTALLCVILIPVACDDKRASPTPPSAEPTTRPDPMAGVDVPALLAAGGENWSALTTGEFAGLKLADGADYYVWPADDVALVRTPESGGTLAVTLNYRKRDGGKPITGGTGYGILVGRADEGRLNLSSPVKPFDAESQSGEMALSFAPYKSTDAGEIVVFFARPGGPDPISNVLRLKVAARP